MKEPTMADRCPITGHQSAEPIDPGPKPGFRYTFQWLTAPLLSALRVQRDHGGIARLRVFGHPVVQISSPTAIRRIMVTNASNYRRGRYHCGLQEWMGDGLITLDDDPWRSHRTVLQPAFTPQALAEQFEHVVYGVRKQMQRWEGLVEQGTRVNLVEEANELVSRAFGMALIDRDLDKDLVRAVAIAIEAAFRRSMRLEPIPSFIPTRYNRRKRWAHKKFDSVAEETAARLKTDSRMNIATLLLRSALPKRAFGDNLRTVFIAGADTTGMGLAWTLWELSRHPEVREQVEREADAVLGDREPTYSDLAALPICRAVVDESLRLHPPIWVMPRTSKEADVLDGRLLPANSHILMPFFGTHRSARYWADPDSFDHRRFLGTSSARKSQAYLPFGAGKHQCVGKDLALTTLVAAVAMLSRRFRITADDSVPVEHQASTTLQPRRGIWATIRHREDVTAGESFAAVHGSHG